VTFRSATRSIYPNHGLGIVERIEEKTILGTTCGFYHLRIAANDTTVLVPLANVDGVGLRRAIDDGEVDRLFKLLGTARSQPAELEGPLKDNSEKMRTGSIYDVADVLKSLTLLSKSKSLSFREKRMLDRARSSSSPRSRRSRAAARRRRGDFSTRRCPSASRPAAANREGEGRQGSHQAGGDEAAKAS